jgi:hypothetical protein
MGNDQSDNRDPHKLFREIDDLCEEVDSAAADATQEARMSEIQHALKDQERRAAAERQSQYAQLLSCRLVEVEIQPFETPRDRAFLTVRSSAGVFRHSLEVAECFAFVEYLLAHGFAAMSTGKLSLGREPRDTDDRVFTWFILGKPVSHMAVGMDAPRLSPPT